MIIPLNIVTTYPVRWGKYEILRDYVQNFYDSVDHKVWSKKFQYAYDENARQLRMWVDKVTFHYEWLMHIGASTKTGHSGSNAGYFGEGFKIASLCAFRDYHWQISMSSGKWTLRVITQKHTIDGTSVTMLAYDIAAASKQKDRSILCLTGISPYDYQMFRETLLSFYYPDNPFMGKKLWEGYEGAVYERTNKAYLDALPVTAEYGTKGLVYCGYQLLGTCPFRLVVCLHHYKKEDRERKALYTFQVIDVFQAIAYHITPSGALYLLESMRRYWNSYPHRHIDIHSWSGVIDSLIQKVASSQNIKNKFYKRHPNLLCVFPPRTIAERNRRAQARSWLATQSGKYLLVKGSFQAIGYGTLEEECGQNGGFVLDDKIKDPTYKKCVEILEMTVKKIFKGIFLLDDWPECRMILNEKAAYQGMATVFKKSTPLLNAKGRYIRYDIGVVYLKKSLFCQAGYYDALATYVHEMCHMFGGDKSDTFSCGLTDAIEFLLRNHVLVEAGWKKWKEVAPQREE